MSPDRPAGAPFDTPGDSPGHGGRQFKRELRPLDATLIVVGSMIGSGIFIVSADIARMVGSPGHLILVWAITGVMTIVGALSYGELAGMMPGAGGQYVYLREAYNPLIGFLYGWTFFVIIQTGTIAAVGVAFAKFTAVLIPPLGEGNILLSIGPLRLSAARLVGIASIVLLTWVNTRGIHGGKLVQNTFTIAKTIALLALVILGLLVGRNAEAISRNFGSFWAASRAVVDQAGSVTREPLAGLALLAAIGAAMVGSLFSSDAWNSVTFAGAEIVRPKRTIPLSLFAGTLTVIILYLLANLSYIMILPVTGSPSAPDVAGRGIQFAANDRVGTAAAWVLFGEPAALIMAVLIMISTFGCNNGLILSGARVTYAMARDGLFFRRVGDLNSKAVPGLALVIQAVWASLLCLSGTYNDLLDYVIFAVLVFYILTVLGIFLLRKRRPDAERPYKAIGYPVLPALYILAAAAVSIDLLIMKPVPSWTGVGIVLLGIPVYSVWKKATR